jgi:ABC-2 type transport system permease protein
MDTLKIYWALALASIRARMEYKVSFIVFIFVVIMFYLLQLTAVVVVIARFKEVHGWKMGDMAFLFGLLTFSQGFTTLFFNSLINFDGMLINGDFDRVLVRPLNPLPQVIFSKFEASTIAHSIIGAVALYYGAKFSGIHWTFGKTVSLPLVIFGGVLIQGAIRLFVTAVAFWTLRNSSLVHTVVFSGKEFVVYPITIYNFGVQFFLTFIFPVAFINFYPAQYFLDKTSETLFHPLLRNMTPVVGVILFFFSLLAWRKGVDHYQSSGS